MRACRTASRTGVPVAPRPPHRAGHQRGGNLADGAGHQVRHRSGHRAHQPLQFPRKVQRLPIEPVSQASANQRKGRCGRVSEGVCIRLYSEQDFLSRPALPIRKFCAPTASVILQMTSLGLGDIAAFPFVEAPDKRNIQDGVRLLEELGAIATAENGHYQLTPQGRQLAQLPIDPRLARMVLEAQKSGSVREVMIITAALSIQDPRERPMDKQQASDENTAALPTRTRTSGVRQPVGLSAGAAKANSSSQFRRLCRNDFLNYLRVREWQDIYTQLRRW